MTNEEKVEKIKALIQEIDELSKELSEEDLKQVAGGLNSKEEADRAAEEARRIKESIAEARRREELLEQARLG